VQGPVLTPNKPNKIVGEWVIEATTLQGAKHQYNICPRINFKNNGKSTVFYPDSSKDGYYDWSIEGDTITLQCTEHANTFPYFSHFKYAIAYSEKNEYTELTLSAGSMIYFLIRKH
jgi:Lipocalin-like domain